MAIKPLVGLGVGLFGGGAFWVLFNYILTGTFISYVRDTSDKYYLASDLLWASLPYVMLIIGVICLVLSGFNNSDGGE